MFAWFKGVSNCLAQSVRYASSLAPRRFKYRKAHKGRLPVHTGGSQAGTCLVYGRFGLRLLEPTRLSATQIEAVTKAIKRKLRSNKQTKIWLRVFPDVAVCKKGNEVRMGKGKGAFDHWACRVGWNRILLGDPPLPLVPAHWRW